MSFVLRPPDEQIPISQRLRSLGRTRRFALIVGGFSLAIAVIAATTTLILSLDSWLNLPNEYRSVGLLGLLALAGTGFHRGVRQPLKIPQDPVAVAQIVESKYPEFNDLLASAAAFENQQCDEPSSARFQQVVIRRAERMARRNDFSKIVPAGPAMRNAVAAIAAIGMLAVFITLDPSRAAVAATRLIDPFGHHPWPLKTSLELLEPTASVQRLAKGDPFIVHFRVGGVLPSNVQLSLKLIGGQESVESIPLDADTNPTAEIEWLVLPDRTTRDFEFRITANDAQTEWKTITVSEPPRLTLLHGRPSPQIRLSFPEYTGEQPTQLPDGTGGIETVAGTTIELRAQTDRPIVNATLKFEGNPNAVLHAASIASLATQNPILSVAAPPTSQSFLDEIPVIIDGADRNHLRANFEPRLSGLYSLRFTDEQGLTGSQKLDISTYPDPAPIVALLRPTPSIDPLVLLPTASLPISIRADDRSYALRRVWLEYRVNDGYWSYLPLVDLPTAIRTLPALVGGIANDVRIRPHELDSRAQLPIATFRRADGQPPGDGDRIHLRAAADDWDNYTIAKHPGRSGEVEIQILSQESLSAVLQKELAELRPEIERAKAMQSDATAKIEIAQKSIRSDGQLSADGRDKLDRVDRDQRTLRAQLADPRDGIRAKAERIRDIAKTNALRDTPAFQRAETVSRLLGEIEDRHLSQIETQLMNAKAATEKSTAKEPLARIRSQQTAVLEKLSAVAEELEQWAATAEVRGNARQLKEQIDKAAAEAKAISDRLPPGATPDRLKDDDRAALNKASDNLKKAADQAGKLLSKADRVAEQRRTEAAKANAAADAKSQELQAALQGAKDLPVGTAERTAAERRAATLEAELNQLRDASAKAEQEARNLDKATSDAGRQALADDLRQAAEAQRNNQSGDAQNQIRKSLERVNKLIDELAERKDDIDQLTKKRKEAEQRIDQLADRQDELAKKVERQNDNPDESDRANEFQKLGAEQEALRKETEQLSRKLDRDGASEAAEQLRRAAQEMEKARDELIEGRNPQSKPDDALERLENAKEKLQQEQPQEQNQLEREQREEFTNQFQNFLDKQKSATEESERLTSAAAKAKKWERPLQASLAALGDREKSLAREIRQFADEKTKELKVFDALLRQAAARMDQAAERIAERKADIILADPNAFDEESEAAADETVRTPMRTALRRLESIVQSLKDDMKAQAAKAQPRREGEPGMPMPGPMGGMGSGTNVSPVAQLKALRDWQRDVNERTEAFAKAHPNRDQLTDDDKDELLEIEASQKEIAVLLESILPMLQQAAGGELP